jgi:transcriptional regulator with GAF, ATPase, and Fis domain
VRELHNLVERAVVLAPTTQGTLRFDLGDPPRPAAREEPNAAGESPRLDLERYVQVMPVALLRKLERRNIVNALAQCGYQIAGDHGAAKLLGMSPSTLAYHMKRLGLRRPADPRNPVDTG